MSDVVSTSIIREELLGTKKSASAPTQSRSVSSARDVIELELEHILPSPFQPRRRRITKESVSDLMASMESMGQLQPIEAEALPDGQFYVHSGHRRCAALRFLGRSHVCAIVRKFEAKEARKLALADNLGREDLSGVELADALVSYANDYGMTLNEAAQQMGIAETARKRLTVIASAPVELREAMLVHGSSQRLAELIVKIERESPSTGLRRLRAFGEGKTSIAKLERELRDSKSVRQSKAEEPDTVVFDVNERGRIELRIRMSTLTTTDAVMEDALGAVARFLREIGHESVNAASA